jgi:hypothetical protein
LTLGLDRLAAVNLRLVKGSRSGDRFDALLAALVEARDEGLIDGRGRAAPLASNDASTNETSMFGAPDISTTCGQSKQSSLQPRVDS